MPLYRRSALQFKAIFTLNCRSSISNAACCARLRAPSYQQIRQADAATDNYYPPTHFAAIAINQLRCLCLHRFLSACGCWSPRRDVAPFVSYITARCARDNLNKVTLSDANVVILLPGPYRQIPPQTWRMNVMTEIDAVEIRYCQPGMAASWRVGRTYWRSGQQPQLCVVVSINRWNGAIVGN